MLYTLQVNANKTSINKRLSDSFSFFSCSPFTILFCAIARFLSLSYFVIQQLLTNSLHVDGFLLLHILRLKTDSTGERVECLIHLTRIPKLTLLTNQKNKNRCSKSDFNLKSRDFFQKKKKQKKNLSVLCRFSHRYTVSDTIYRHHCAVS